MEELIRELIGEFREFKCEMLEFKQDMLEFRQDMLGFKQDMLGFKQEMLGFKQEMLGFKEDMLGFKQDTNGRLDRLEILVEGMKDEHGRMLAALIENKEIQRGEINTIKYQVAKVEGTLKGAAQYVLEGLDEAAR